MNQDVFSAILGLDIGRINTRASLFVISEGKYCLSGHGIAPTTLGLEMHLGVGAGDAMQKLQERSGHVIMKAEGGLILPATAVGLGVDRVGLVTSTGSRIRTVLLGLSKDGSLKAGRALIHSMMLDLVGCYSIGYLKDESRVVDGLIRTRPDLVLLVGGEDAGAEKPLRRWVEVLRWAYVLIPEQIKPAIIYAGNPSLEADVRRRLEPLAPLHISPNIQPAIDDWDLVPAQNLLEQEILRIWKEQIPGLGDMTGLPQTLSGTNDFMFDRMMRYLTRVFSKTQSTAGDRGVLTVDLGGGSTTLSAGLGNRTGTVILDAWDGITSNGMADLCQGVHRWAAIPVTEQEVQAYLIRHALHPAIAPENTKELALSQAAARCRLQFAVKRFSETYAWLKLNPERMPHVEPVIASGAVISHAPTWGQAMLILLDGLQPCGVTTFVLDRYHLLPVLGAAGEAQPVLPVHVLASDAFVNLGTVISPVSRVSLGKEILTVRITTEDGKAYSVDIVQGTLRRVVIPAGEAALLELEPSHRTDIGFGGMGVGGRLKVTGGALGVVIDARGRPLRLPDGDERRAEEFRGWLLALGG